MQKGVYIRDLKNIYNFLKTRKENIECIAIGNYGCLKAVPATDEILSVKKILDREGISLYYISPKITQSDFEEEFKRVSVLCNLNISIGVNDWGILYRLTNRAKETVAEKIIGRLLSKSLSDWYWSDIFFSREQENTKIFFNQNGFNHQLKIDLLKRMGVSGIEVNIKSNNEKSLKDIKTKGLYIIGFADDMILAVSRSCPIHRAHTGFNSRKLNCGDCNTTFQLKPLNNNSSLYYPNFQVQGNVITEINTAETNETSVYEKIFYNQYS